MLTGAVREHPLPKPDGKGRPWRFDIAWPALCVCVEVDGGRWLPGGGRHSSDGDYRKRNAAMLAGWSMLAFTTSQLGNNPKECVRVIEAMLTRVGFTA